MYKPFVALLGMLLGSHAPAAAQTPAAQLVLAQERAAPTMAMLPTVSTAFPAGSTLVSQDTGKSPVHFNPCTWDLTNVPQPGAATPDGAGQKFVFDAGELAARPILGRTAATGRLSKHASHSERAAWSLGYGGMQGFRSARQSYSGGPMSVRVTGLSLSFHFGGDARAARPTEVLRRLTRMVGNVLN